MSLRTKMALIVSAIFVLYALAEYAIQHYIIYPEFVALEQEQGQKNMDRVLGAIQNEINHLSSLCHDWAAWDDTYTFVSATTNKYISANLTPSTFIDNHIHLLCFIDAHGAKIWGEAHDLEKVGYLHLPYFEKDQFKSSDPLLAFETRGKPLANVQITGVFMTIHGPMLTVSRPILTSNNEGPIAGAVIMGRFLTPPIQERLRKQTLMKFTLIPLNADSDQARWQTISRQINPQTPYFYEYRGDNYLHVYSLYKDIRGDGAFLIHLQNERSITVRGLKTIQHALLSKGVAGLTILIVILLLLQYTTLNPLDRLKNGVLKVGETGELAMPTHHFHQDEIGALAREFDKMLRQLDAARKRIAEQSHRYGMSQMASEILHNARNTMTPLIGQIGLLQRLLQKAKIREVQMALKELENQSVTEPRRSELVRFSILTNKSQVAMLKEALVKLDVIANITHQIEKMLDDYQILAYSKRKFESVRIDGLIADSVKQVNPDLLKTIQVQVDPRDAQGAMIITDRIALSKVLVSVLTNAAESIQRGGDEPGQIRITVQNETGENGDRVNIRICDNGEGVREESPELIFRRNYSRKKQRSSVFGLHWCANTINALGGRMYAANRQTEKGACVYIFLPRGVL